MNRFALGQYQVDYEARIDWDQLRTDKIKRVCAAMKEAGLPALFLWRDENVRYLTNLRIIMLQYRASTTYGVFLHQDGDLVLFLSSGELVRAQHRMPWIKQFEPIPIMDEHGMVAEVVKNKVLPVFQKYGVEEARVGMDMMTTQQMAAYQYTLPRVEWADGATVMQSVRMIKNDQEIMILEEATAIADAVTQTAIDTVRPGIREFDVAAEAMRTLFQYGGEFAHLASPFVASGERMSPPTRFPTDKIIRYGDIVFIDIGAAWNGYFGDVGRSIICGRPSSKQKRIYRAVYEAQQAGISAMNPGRKISEVAAVYHQIADKYDLADHFINLFIGHGIGAAPAEPPFVGETQSGSPDYTLQSGMVFAMEPLIHVDGTRGGGGVRLEDMILITKDGPHLMSRAPYDDRLLD